MSLFYHINDFVSNLSPREASIRPYFHLIQCKYINTAKSVDLATLITFKFCHTRMDL